MRARPTAWRVSILFATRVLALSRMRDRVAGAHAGHVDSERATVRRVDSQSAHVVRRRADAPASVERACRRVEESVGRGSKARIAGRQLSDNRVAAAAGRLVEISDCASGHSRNLNDIVARAKPPRLLCGQAAVVIDAKSGGTTALAAEYGAPELYGGAPTWTLNRDCVTMEGAVGAQRTGSRGTAIRLGIHAFIIERRGEVDQLEVSKIVEAERKVVHVFYVLLDNSRRRKVGAAAQIERQTRAEVGHVAIHISAETLRKGHVDVPAKADIIMQHVATCRSKWGAHDACATGGAANPPDPIPLMVDVQSVLVAGDAVTNEVRRRRERIDARLLHKI